MTQTPPNAHQCNVRLCGNPLWEMIILINAIFDRKLDDSLSGNTTMKFLNEDGLLFWGMTTVRDSRTSAYENRDSSMNVTTLKFKTSEQRKVHRKC